MLRFVVKHVLRLIMFLCWVCEILILSKMLPNQHSRNKKKKKKKIFVAPSYAWGSTASRLEPLQEGSLLFTIKFPETGTICAKL